ncbi:substrate-binding periplasmic protein [Shewanella sp. ENK2]|uniref:substrate-binding periplasmic protein n=1 Tax=Shewanella sp. ENK2 TaxID=2775245 RepID=UPI00374A9177
MNKTLTIIITICLFVATPLQAKPVVNVGGYLFAPYVDVSEDGLFQGFTIDLIAAFNQLQTEVEFQFVNTSIENRYQAYDIRRFDMMFFESPIWGWKSFIAEFIPLDIVDGEVFITLRDGVKDQQYFDSFGNKSLSLVSGYHYQFAQWNNNEQDLMSDFDIQFVHTNRASIESVLKGRADIAPVTLSYLQHYIKMYPKIRDNLLISEKLDQTYSHSILLNPKAVISKAKLQKWLSDLQESGRLNRIAKKYDLAIKPR